MKKVIFMAAAIFAVLGAAFSALMNFPTGEEAPLSGSELEVHFIDVGQGDCTFILLPDGKTMLIDAGNNSDGEKVVGYIKNLGVTGIDYLIGTHPHADHIGGMDTVIANFDIGEIFMPQITTDTKTFEDVLDAIDAKNLTVTAAKNGVNIFNNGESTADIIAPNSTFYDSLNDYSAVVMLKYRNSSFLFMGDAEETSEKEITENVSADVLKVGHHGSSTSSGMEFLRRVCPKYAVISCGEGNSYSHPHSETLERLESLNVAVYRTDLGGSIICRTDGKNYTWECEG